MGKKERTFQYNTYISKLTYFQRAVTNENYIDCKVIEFFQAK